jgi:hypothetical protein
MGEKMIEKRRAEDGFSAPLQQTRRPDDARLERSKAQLDHIAWLMDECFRIPGVNWRFGADAIIGLIPGAGDIIGALIGLVLLVRAFQYRLPKVVIARMVLNNVIDVTVGSIPLLGDAFDFFWKSNSKNMKLFHEYAGQPEQNTTRHWLFLASLIALFVMIFFFVLSAIIYLAARTIGFHL